MFMLLIYPVCKEVRSEKHHLGIACIMPAWILSDSVKQKRGISDGAPSIQLFAMFGIPTAGIVSF